VFESAGVPSAIDVGTRPSYSWLGDWYSHVSTAGGVLAALAGPIVDVADSAWAMPQGNRSRTQAAALPSSRAVRDKVKNVALSHVGSMNWANQGDQSFCNVFVEDVLTEAKANPPDGGPRATWKAILKLDWNYPALAADWARPGTVMKCWLALSGGPDAALPGDVIATEHNTPNASGHVGIVVGTEQTASTDGCVVGFEGIIAVNNFGFRLTPPDPCRQLGMKSESVVKRWKCY
jgi:hypothetical protein